MSDVAAYVEIEIVVVVVVVVVEEMISLIFLLTLASLLRTSSGCT